MYKLVVTLVVVAVVVVVELVVTLEVAAATELDYTYYQLLD
jgi:hypothetical protein